jgi:hypothetical protein
MTNHRTWIARPRKLPKVERWKEELVDTLTKPKELPTSSLENLSVDTLLEKVLFLVATALKGTENEIFGRLGVKSPSRDVLMNLKDCHTILADMKKRETESLAMLSDEELEKLSKK